MALTGLRGLAVGIRPRVTCTRRGLAVCDCIWMISACLDHPVIRTVVVAAAVTLNFSLFRDRNGIGQLANHAFDFGEPVQGGVRYKVTFVIYTIYVLNSDALCSLKLWLMKWRSKVVEPCDSLL